MEALGVLAVAERDIRALSTTRADSGPLRRLRSLRSPEDSLRSTSEPWLASLARTPRPRLTGRSSPFGQWRVAPRTPRPSSPPGEMFVSSATERSTPRWPVQPEFPWRT